MKTLRKLFFRISLLLPYLIVFVLSLYHPVDPDLGWHLKYGEYFWQHGTVLRDNTFSTMMPNYHWANTSWLTDIIVYTAFHLGGFFGVTLLGALVVTLTFYFFSKAAGLSLWEQAIVFPFIVYLEAPINEVSFRGQQIVLLCVGILFYLISLYEKKPKILWWAVPLFWIWASIDGEFILGYALFGLWVVLYFLRKIVQGSFLSKDLKRKQSTFSLRFEKIKSVFAQDKEEMTVLLWILIASLAATFVNPFGYYLHLDALSHVGSPLLKDIGEYLPFGYLSQDWWNEIIVGIILIFGLFILSFKGKFWKSFPVLGGGLLLFMLSLGIRRYAWPAYYLVFPLLGMAASFLKPDSNKIANRVAVVLLIILLLTTVRLRYPFTQFTNFTWVSYCQSQVLPCSPASAEYLISHHLTHNIYTLYGWGGWLIWNYPQIKPSIDGRMHLWVQNGYSAFIDYYNIEQNFSDIDQTKYTVAYMSPEKPVYDRLIELTKEGKWKKVYEDQYAGIFVKNQ